MHEWKKYNELIILNIALVADTDFHHVIDLILKHFAITYQPLFKEQFGGSGIVTWFPNRIIM